MDMILELPLCHALVTQDSAAEDDEALKASRI